MGLLQSVWSILRLFFFTTGAKVNIPPNLSFAGQTVLITGGTSGLGLEASILYVNLGAETVIITARTAAKGQAAKAEIEARTGKKNVIQVRVLDMDTFAGVQKFMEDLKKEVKELDIAFLNAGIHSFDYATLPNGWEADLQVNVLSTALLALLFLPWMRSICKPRQVQHLAFTGSGGHMDADISKVWPKKDVLAFWNKKENYINGRNNYAVSKLLQQYAVRGIAKLAVDQEGRPSPIVTSVCPGLIKTDISRYFEQKSFFHKVVAKIFLGLKSSPADVGAKALVWSSISGPEKQGGFLRPYLTDEEYAEKSQGIIESAEGRKMQSEVWKEIIEVLKKPEPELV